MYVCMYVCSSLYHAVENYCDVTATVRKSMLPVLAYYAEDEEERKTLLHLASKKGR